jgi:hypothetical protein
LKTGDHWGERRKEEEMLGQASISVHILFSLTHGNGVK